MDTEQKDCMACSCPCEEHKEHTHKDDDKRAPNTCSPSNCQCGNCDK